MWECFQRDWNEEETHPGCGWHYPTDWGPIQEENEKWERELTTTTHLSVSWLQAHITSCFCSWCPGLLYQWGYAFKLWLQRHPFFLKLLTVRYLLTARRKVRKTGNIYWLPTTGHTLCSILGTNQNKREKDLCPPESSFYWGREPRKTLYPQVY